MIRTIAIACILAATTLCAGCKTAELAVDEARVEARAVYSPLDNDCEVQIVAVGYMR